MRPHENGGSVDRRPLPIVMREMLEQGCGIDEVVALMRDAKMAHDRHIQRSEIAKAAWRRRREREASK